MNQKEQNVAAAAAAPRKRMIKWVVVAFFVALAAVAVMNLPRGYSDDLSRIGKGKAAVVLIRDKNAVQTFDLMEVMNGLRDQYAGQVEFLLTDFNTPQGRAFIAANNAARVTLVLLDADGKLVNVLYPPQTAESLQQEIAGALRAAPKKTSGGTTDMTTDKTTSHSTWLPKDDSLVAGYGRAPG